MQPPNPIDDHCQSEGSQRVSDLFCVKELCRTNSSHAAVWVQYMLSRSADGSLKVKQPFELGWPVEWERCGQRRDLQKVKLEEQIAKEKVREKLTQAHDENVKIVQTTAHTHTHTHTHNMKQ